MKKATLLCLCVVLLLLVAFKDATAEQPETTASLVNFPYEDFQDARSELVSFAQTTADYWEALSFVGHLNYIADVPPEYGWMLYRAAKEAPDLYKDLYKKEEDVTPEEVAELTKVGLLELGALFISEHSGPDLDFSIEASEKRRYDFTYDPKSKGAYKERGLFQIKPRWAKKAGVYLGTGWTEEDLFDPEINTKVAVFVVVHNKKSHRKCLQRKHGLHEHWIAHYKCAQKDRDIIDPMDFCRFKQKKFEKLLFSVTQVESPDLEAIGTAHNDRMKKVQKARERSWKRKQKAARKAFLRKREKFAKMTPEDHAEYADKELAKLKKRVKKEKKRRQRQEKKKVKALKAGMKKLDKKIRRLDKKIRRRAKKKAK